MTWYEFLGPAAAVALIVRSEAKLIGPYWSWLELIPYLGFEDSGDSKKRRAALVRRVAIPGLAALILRLAWPSTYPLVDTLIVSAGAGGLLLWPALFGQLPYGIPTARLLVMYLALLMSFVAVGLVGWQAADLIQAEGGVWSFLQKKLLELSIGTVAAAFALGLFDRIASRTEGDTTDVND